MQSQDKEFPLLLADKTDFRRGFHCSPAIFDAFLLPLVACTPALPQGQNFIKSVQEGSNISFETHIGTFADVLSQ